MNLFGSSRVLVSLGTSFLMAQSALAGGAAGSAQTAGAIAAATILPSILTGTALQVPCSAPGGQAACAMMLLAFLQAGGSAGNAANSGASASGLSTGNSNGASADYTNPLTTTRAQDAKALQSVGLGSLVSDYSSLKAAVATSGVALSADGTQVTLPGGKTVPTSAFTSDSGMKNAGFSDSEIARVDSALKNAALKIDAAKSKIASLTNDQGGGGGGLGGGGETSTSSSGGGFNPYGSRPSTAKGESLAGMSKKLGNDSIGVAGDDIFQMITRRYQARDKADGFLKK